MATIVACFPHSGNLSFTLIYLTRPCKGKHLSQDSSISIPALVKDGACLLHSVSPTVDAQWSRTVHSPQEEPRRAFSGLRASLFSCPCRRSRLLCPPCLILPSGVSVCMPPALLLVKSYIHYFSQCSRRKNSFWLMV